MALTDSLSTGHSQGVEAVLALASEKTVTFESAYDAYFDYVWRVMRRLGVPEASAEDATHDVFLVVHRQLAGFAGRSTLKTWIYGIGIRVARDYRRRDKRKGGLETLGEHVSEARSPEDASADHEAVRMLDAVLNELSEDKRETYVLAEIEGMSVPEIAEAIGTNANTLYSRLRAAKQHVETRLAEVRR
jgi:RNA polymerase sigma-70 factor (ECF subfamily)